MCACDGVSGEVVSPGHCRGVPPAAVVGIRTTAPHGHAPASVAPTLQLTARPCSAARFLPCTPGGIYVQEPDCGPAALDSLVELTNTHTDYLPLGGMR